MTTLVIVALALMIGGLVLCVLSPNAGSSILSTVFWWVGLLLAILGLVLILTPVVVYISRHLQEMFGIR